MADRCVCVWPGEHCRGRDTDMGALKRRHPFYRKGGGEKRKELYSLYNLQ